MSAGNVHVPSAAAAVRGHGGCQLSIAKEWAQGASAIGVKEEHLHLIAKNTQYLVVKCVVLQSLKFLILCAHASRSGSANGGESSRATLCARQPPSGGGEPT